MYGIYAYIDPPNHPNVGIYDIHGVSGKGGVLSQAVTAQQMLRLSASRVWSSQKKSLAC